MSANRLRGSLFTSLIALILIGVAANPAVAQKRGGALRLYHNDNPPSTSLLEESTIASVTLRQGVKWHDGTPFTAKDVQCTWRMLIGKGETPDFHRNPRKVWYSKLQDVSINGDYRS